MNCAFCVISNTTSSTLMASEFPPMFSFKWLHIYHTLHTNTFIQIYIPCIILRVSAKTNDTHEQTIRKSIINWSFMSTGREKRNQQEWITPESSNSGTLLPFLVWVRQEGKQVQGPRRNSYSSESLPGRSCAFPVNQQGRH